MAYAKCQGFVVLTHDLDSGAILAATGGDSPSVLQIRADDTSPEAVGAAVLAALRQMADELAAGGRWSPSSRAARACGSYPFTGRASGRRRRSGMLHERHYIAPRKA